MTKPDIELVKLIEIKQLKLEKKVISVWGKDSLPSITINFDLDSSRTLGSHSYNSFDDIHVISLNPKLLNEYKEKYINEVFVHEYAHAITTKNYPPSRNTNWKRTKPHGKEFKSVCSLFGIVGKATSSLVKDKTLLKTKNKQRRFSYTCDCGHNHQVSTTIHNKILRGSRRICSKCNTIISLVK